MRFKLLLLFVIVPVTELFLFLRIGSKIGVPATLGIILLTAIIGAALTKSQGARALSSFREAMARGALPHREALDGLLILLAGAVLLTPGFLTDTAGFLLLFPATREVIRNRLVAYLKGRIQIIGPPPTDRGPTKRPAEDTDFIDI
ncbi:MAG: FxsA family protein [Verrucomicrobiota bacterium]|nr:FxsA family protein [Verrucomicrobiota bacterium]